MFQERTWYIFLWIMISFIYTAFNIILKLALYFQEIVRIRMWFLIYPYVFFWWCTFNKYKQIIEFMLWPVYSFTFNLWFFRFHNFLATFSKFLHSFLFFGAIVVEISKGLCDVFSIETYRKSSSFELFFLVIKQNIC